jgi:hypothetical protein
LLRFETLVTLFLDKAPPWLPRLSHYQLYLPVRITWWTSRSLSHPSSEFEMFFFLFGWASIFFRCLSPWTSLLETVSRVIFLFSDVSIVFRQTAGPDSRVSPFWAHNWTFLLPSLVSLPQRILSAKSLIVCLEDCRLILNMQKELGIEYIY